MARTTASDVLVRTLMDRDVDTIVGIPGDTAGKIALTVASDRVREVI